jgi:hypothetical protein
LRAKLSLTRNSSSNNSTLECKCNFHVNGKHKSRHDYIYFVVLSIRLSRGAQALEFAHVKKGVILVHNEELESDHTL